MVAIMFIASMAYADERLSLSGQVRAWGWSVKGYGIDDGGEFGADPDESADFFAQRFRLAAKITASEGVYGHLRFDFAESTWGGDSFNGYRNDTTNDNSGDMFQVDRAYLEVDKEKFNVKAGQLLTGLGSWIVVDMQGQGAHFTYKATDNLGVTALWLKRDEGDARTDFEGTDAAGNVVDTEDIDVYALNVAFSKEDKFSGNFFFATSIDKTAADDDTQNAIGVQGTAALGKINLTAELDYLFGEDKVNDLDYIGTQLYVDLNTNINDSTMAGLRLMYAMGNDDADKRQLSNLNRGQGFGDWLPYSFGIYDDGDIDPVFDLFGQHPMEIGGANSGTMAVALYGEKVIKEKLALRGLLAYAAPSEDEVTVLDSIININAGAEYEFAQDTVVQGCVNYIIPSFDDNSDDDAALGLFAGVRMNF